MVCFLLLYNGVIICIKNFKDVIKIKIKNFRCNLKVLI